MRVLVTGASGFLGGHMIEGLLGRGHDVVGLARKTSDVSRLEGLGIELRVGDVTSPASLDEATRGIDAVVHLAAYYTFIGKKDLYTKINVEGTRNLLESMVRNGVQRFIHCSSTEAIGPIYGKPANEDSPPNPTYDYGRSKVASEKVVRDFSSRGIDYTIIRPSGIYGPRNVNDVSFWTITSFAKNDVGTRFIIGSGNNLVQFCHVDDVVRGFALALEKPGKSAGKTYIVSDSRAYSYKEVYSILSKVTGRKMPTMRVPAALAKAFMLPVVALNKILGRENFLYNLSTVDSVTNDRSYSIDRIRSDLGYEPMHDLASGLEETYRWYRENGHI